VADSEYVIQIATDMPDGAATLAELDALADKLTGAGRRSDSFQSALKRMTSDLDAAKSASAEAAAALALGNDQYKILERDAIRAGKAVEKAQGKGQFDARAARDAHLASAALDEYTATLRGLERASEAASGKQDKLGKSLANLNKIGAHSEQRAALMNQKYEKLQAAVSRLPGPLGQIGSQLVGSAKAAHGVQASFGGAEAATLALAAGAVVAVAAVVALTVAFVAGVVAITRYAVAQADAARQALLSREAFAALSDETAAGVGAFDAISAATGLADKDLVGLTKQLRAAKVSASDMPDALRAAALAERALGTGGASEFIDRIREGEDTVRGFARTAEDKFGGIVAEQLRGLDAQMERADKNWSRLFQGIDLDPFLDALSVLTNMFEKGGPLAQAFGGAVEGAINPLGPMALQAAYAIEAFVLEFAIQLTKMYLFIKPAVKWLGELFGAADDGTALIDVLGALGSVAAAAAVVFGVALVAAVGAVSAVIAIGVGMMAAFVAGVTLAVVAVWDFLSGLYAFGSAVVEWATTVGVDLMMGLVNGITSAVSAVITAVSDAVGGAIDAAKEVLGIASPSKVFAEIGVNTVAGFTGAVDDGAADAQGSMAALVGQDAPAPSGAQAGANAAKGAGGGGSKAFDFAGATFNFHGVKDAEQARGMFADMLTRLLEDDADSLGGAEVAT
jgi:hypothetical protein